MREFFRKTNLIEKKSQLMWLNTALINHSKLCKRLNCNWLEPAPTLTTDAQISQIKGLKIYVSGILTTQFQNSI